MNTASTTAPRWAVSTRTRGEVLVAGVSTTALEIVLLGVPSQFTQDEAEEWLHDLAGVAADTARGDARPRPIPPLLYHALTGLLFSQSELWSSGQREALSAAVFVETPAGPAFGWMGDARVQVLVEGQPIEPAWVIVRDEEGRQARGLVLEGRTHAQVVVEHGADTPSLVEPPAAVEADWMPEGRDRAVAHADAPPAPTVNEPEAPAEAAAAIGSPAPDHGVARPANAFEQASALAAEWSHAEPQAVPYDAGAAPAAEAAPASEAGHSAEPGASALDPGTESLSAEQAEALGSLTAPREAHPVGRWLGRLMGFARRVPHAVRRSTRHAEDEATPLSAYDSLLSEQVAETPPLEQTALDLDAGRTAHADAAGSRPDREAPVDEARDGEPSEHAHVPSEVIEDAPRPLRDDALAEQVEYHAVHEAPAAEPDVAEAPAPAVAAAPPPGVESEPRAVAASEPAAPAPAPAPAPPPVPFVDDLTPPAPALESARERLVRAMHEADPASLPVLQVPLPAPPTHEPLAIEHEPVGADVTFAIPVVQPRRPAAPAPAEPPAPHTIELPPSPAPAAAAPVPPRVPAASAPPVLRVRTIETPANAPPVLRVHVPTAPATAPPVLRVEPAAVPPRVIVPTAPVPPIAPDAEAFAPASGLGAPRRAWPLLETSAERRWRVSRRTWVLVAIVVGVFAAGWLVGLVANPDRDQPGPFTRFTRAIGLGGAVYTASVGSTPPGAWIAVDGKDVSKRTPAQVDLPPGEHTLTLSLPELGSASVPVRGRRGDKVSVSPSLNGALDIVSTDAGVPISVSLDGRALGYAPLQVDDVAPGLHEVQFSGPGMVAWAQTVQVGVRKTQELVARPMSAPADGVIQVQATLNDEQGASPLNGAQVFVDGELRGVTPVTLNLPRGPHSLRLTWHGQTAPVQVIDLPGGNERYASFPFGLEGPSAQVTLQGGVHPANAQQSAVVTAGLAGLSLTDIREAWLHVRMPDGLWRRYPMTAMRGARGPVVVCVFPPSGFDAQGTSRWYVSASTQQGDEYFSEMQQATTGGGGGGGAPVVRHRHARAAVVPPATPAPLIH